MPVVAGSYQTWGCTLIRFLRVSATFGTCTVVSVIGTFAEDKMRRFKGVVCTTSVSFRPTHDDASAKFSTTETKRITVWESLADMRCKGGGRVVRDDIESTDVLNNITNPSNLVI